MIAAARFAIGGLVRQPAKTLTRVLVLALAVALVGSMLAFIGHSLRTMTASAVRSVPLDWQGPVASYPKAQSLSAGVARQRGVAYAAPSATGPFAGITHAGSSGLASSGSGSILAVPPNYASHIGTIRYLHGSLKEGQVALDQQLAATLQAGIGDKVSIAARKGAKPRLFRVSGVFRKWARLATWARARPTTSLLCAMRPLSSMASGAISAGNSPSSRRARPSRIRAKASLTARSGCSPTRT